VDKLLLIDDEADVQYSFRRIFDQPEIELTTADSGEEGLKLIPRLKPDLVIMDVRMGGMNGLETLRRLRQMDTKQMVIMMTAYGTTQTAIEAMKLGAYDYLLKPFDVPRLKQIVLDALKAARDMRQVVSYQPLLESEDYDLGIIGRSEGMQAVFKIIGQGTGGAGHLSSQPAPFADFSGHQLRGHPGESAGKRIVRPRKRRFYRRDGAAHRQIRAVQSWHHFSGRDRGHDALHAGEDPARAPIRRV
jgi:CheY-like chemotaxis protein